MALIIVSPLLEVVRIKSVNTYKAYKPVTACNESLIKLELTSGSLKYEGSDHCRN